MHHPTVLVISDEVDFSRSVTARWQMLERQVPTFTLLSGDLWPRSIDNFSVAIVGPLRRELLSLVLRTSTLDSTTPVLRLPRRGHGATGTGTMAAHLSALL